MTLGSSGPSPTDFQPPFSPIALTMSPRSFLFGVGAAEALSSGFALGEAGATDTVGSGVASWEAADDGSVSAEMQPVNSKAVMARVAGNAFFTVVLRERGTGHPVRQHQCDEERNLVTVENVFHSSCEK